ARAVSWGALWDMQRDANLRARDYVPIVLNNVDVEPDAVMVHTLIGHLSSAVELYSDPGNRGELRGLLAAESRRRSVESAPGSDRQLLWVRAFIDTARSPE